MAGQCPQCGEEVVEVYFSAVLAHAPLGDRVNAVSFSCPHCHVILGIQVDPYKLASEVLGDLAGRIGALDARLDALQERIAAR